jgi:hypothetical protein
VDKAGVMMDHAIGGVMPRTNLWNQNLPRAEIDQRSREARLRFELIVRASMLRATATHFRLRRLLYVFTVGRHGALPQEGGVKDPADRDQGLVDRADLLDGKAVDHVRIMAFSSRCCSGTSGTAIMATRVGRWEGNLWARKAAGVAGLCIDDHADDRRWRHCRQSSAATLAASPVG